MHMQREPTDSDPLGQPEAQDLLLGWTLWLLSAHERHSPLALHFEHPVASDGQVLLAMHAPSLLGSKPSTQTHLPLPSAC